MDSLINIPPIEMPGIFVCKSIVMRGTEGNDGEEERVNAGRLRRLRGTRTHLYIFIRVRSVKHERVHRRARMRARERVRACTHDDSETSPRDNAEEEVEEGEEEEENGETQRDLSPKSGGSFFSKISSNLELPILYFSRVFLPPVNVTANCFFASGLTRTRRRFAAHATIDA